MRTDTERGWRVEMFSGERWLCLGEFELQDGRVKRLGSSPGREEIADAARRHATAVESGPPPWSDHYVLDATGLSNLIDEIMDEHRYPPCPDVAPTPVAWRLRNTAFRTPSFRYYETREAAEQDQADFNRSVDDGGLHDLTPLYAEAP